MTTGGIDRYFTPVWTVRQCLTHVVRHVCPFPPSTILEPGAGRGVFVHALRAQFPHSNITAVDIEPTFGPWPGANRSVVGDFLDPQLLNERYALAIGNPPYSLAMQFIMRALALSNVTVFLLRQGFLSSAKRNTFFRMRPPQHVFILAHRPSFVETDTTDKSDYCFVCWAKPTGSTHLHWLPTIPVNERR